MDLLPISALTISGISLIINFFYYRHVTKKADVDHLKELTDKYHLLDKEVTALKTRLDYDIQLLEKLEHKINKLLEIE